MLSSQGAFEAAVEAVIRAALEQPPPLAAYVVPDWPEGDPRWLVGEIQPTWWQIHFCEEVAKEARHRLQRERGQAFHRLLDEGLITRPQLASALGLSLRALEHVLRNAE